jgi:hypothetical protein
MPKVVRTAAQILSNEKPVEEVAPKSPFAGGSLMSRDGAAPAAEAEVKIADPASSEPKAPEAGFETPPAQTDPEPSVPSEKDPAPAADVQATPTPTPEKTFRFVKNIHTHEKIVFKDGTKFQFARSLFETRDPELAAKILAVASQYNIVQ